MRVGIHEDPSNELNYITQKHIKILEYNNIDYVILNCNHCDFWSQLEEIDYFIYIWGHRDDYRQVARNILPVIENNFNIKCYPDQNTCWHYDDKIKQYYIMRKYNFPYTESWIFYNDVKIPLKWIETADYPFVFKLSGGAGSSNVILVKNKKQAAKLITQQFTKGIVLNQIKDKNDLKYLEFNIIQFLKKKAYKAFKKPKSISINSNWQKHKNYVLFQKFLPENDFDTRISVIGDRAFAYRRFNRENDFRSSGSNLLDYSKDKINIEFVKIAFEVSQKLGFQSMAYDFLYNENGNPEFCEISYAFKDFMVYDCPGYWDSNLQFHRGHFWPQYFQLIDFLNMPDLKQPDL